MKTNKIENFLEKNKYKIENEKAFFSLIALIAKEKESYLFRGQANSEWKLQSTFFRRKDIIFKESILFLFY